MPKGRTDRMSAPSFTYTIKVWPEIYVNTNWTTIIIIIKADCYLNKEWKRFASDLQKKE